MLPIVDDLARSLKSAKARTEFEPLLRGIELIYTKCLKLLEQHGVKEVESVGKPFDVNYHEALLQMPKEGIAPHTIIEEVEKGYMLNDRVIRHAKVIVAAEPDAFGVESSGNSSAEKKEAHDKGASSGSSKASD